MSNLKRNKVYKWEDIVREYPDLWVIVTDVKENAGEIVTCRLLDVCTYDGKAQCVKKYINSEMKTRLLRTTFNDPNVGILSLV